MKLDSLSGEYEAEGYGRVRVNYEDKRLILTTPIAEFPLIHLGGTRFGLTATKPVRAGINIDYFEVDFSGAGETPRSLSFNIAAEPVKFRKVGDGEATGL